jgi:hypothetical protein
MKPYFLVYLQGLLKMSVVSVKVSDEVKKDMVKRKGKIQWSEEIRSFILRKLEEEKRRENIEKAERILGRMRGVSRGTASKIIRDDRDRHN